MRWIAGGPDFPPELFQAAEDGKLVFFCGAGVSYRAGLPGFKGLVRKVYEILNAAMDPLESAEFERSNYDRVLALLENRISSKDGTANFVRRAVIRALQFGQTPDFSTHAAILSLSTSRNGICRLVTTNFDNGFERASTDLIIDSAPKLPSPKHAAWKSLVYLHGRISQTDPDGLTLVLTSADFGAAYLTERWASRFISELFRRFTVLFVGYSIEDTVMRYMMDAFAADRALGEGVGKAYALAGAPAGDRDKEELRWKAKGVTPLLYDDANDHDAFHQSLARCAECHRGGLLGKENIIVQYASLRPQKPFDTDPAVSQVIWAVSEKEGHVAGRFAREAPVPPIEWLEAFAESGLLSLTTKQPEAVAVPLVDIGYRTRNPSPLNPITSRLADWLACHLDQPALLQWALHSGGQLHPEFQAIIRRKLDDTSLPPTLREIWSVLCSPGLALSMQPWFFELQQQIQSGLWSLGIKHQLLTALEPVLRLGPSIAAKIFSPADVEQAGISRYAEIDVIPRVGDHIRLLFNAINSSTQKTRILVDLADDLTSHLKLAMELLQRVEKAGPHFDPSYFDMPSISPHKQNELFRTWAVLIELLRRGWDDLLRVDRDLAIRLIERWRTIRYPVFRRLCLYGMSVSDLYAADDCISFLQEDDGRWLWSANVYREKFRLLMTTWEKVSDGVAAALVECIVAGPPRQMFRLETTEADYRKLGDRETWLHLAKLQSTGRALPLPGAEKLRELTELHPEWQLSDGDRDEFVVWTEGGEGEPPTEQADEFLNLPDDEIQAKLLDPTLPRDQTLGKWHSLVAQQPDKALGVLDRLSASDAWPADIWGATMAMPANQHSFLDWPRLTGLLGIAPDDLHRACVRETAWLLRQVSEKLQPDLDDSFLIVWDRCQPFAFAMEREAVGDPIGAAINEPAGYLTQALLGRATARRPKSADDIPVGIWDRMGIIVSGHAQMFQLARIVLASRLAWLHSLDPSWTEGSLLPFFAWTGSDEAPWVWQGFLWQARIPTELWPKIKRDFLLAIREKERLDKFQEQICTLFGAICAYETGWLTVAEARDVLRATDPNGRATVASVFFRQLEAAGEKAESLWNERTSKWLDQAWPKDRDLVDANSAFNWAMAAVCAGRAFPRAVEAVSPFLTRNQDYPTVVRKLNETAHTEKYPESALRLVDLIVDTEYVFPDDQLREVLTKIVAARPALAADPTLRSLFEYLHRFNR